MAAKKKPEPGLGNAKQLRMSEELEERVQKYQEQFCKDTGVKLDFSTAVRALLEYALNQKGF